MQTFFLLGITQKPAVLSANTWCLFTHVWLQRKHMWDNISTAMSKTLYVHTKTANVFNISHKSQLRPNAKFNFNISHFITSVAIQAMIGTGLMKNRTWLWFGQSRWSDQAESGFLRPIATPVASGASRQMVYRSVSHNSLSDHSLFFWWSQIVDQNRSDQT